MAQPILPSITSYLPYDIQSLLPRHSSEVSESPEIDSKAPSLKDQSIDYANSKGWIVACVRHPGCPFAEKEARDLSTKLKENESLSVVIIQHAEGQELEKWAETVGLPQSHPRLHLLAAPDRSLYGRFGIGQMAWTGLFSKPMLDSLLDLRSKGISNTKTGSCSNRWQNSGSFAIDTSGAVKWKHLAAHAGDMADFDEALKALGI